MSVLQDWIGVFVDVASWNDAEIKQQFTEVIHYTLLLRACVRFWGVHQLWLGNWRGQTMQAPRVFELSWIVYSKFEVVLSFVSTKSSIIENAWYSLEVLWVLGSPTPRQMSLDRFLCIKSS